MAKYKAKESYLKLTNEENFIAYQSASTHLKLINGLKVEIKSVPKKIEKHLNKLKQ